MNVKNNIELFASYIFDLILVVLGEFFIELFFVVFFQIEFNALLRFLGFMIVLFSYIEIRQSLTSPKRDENT